MIAIDVKWFALVDIWCRHQSDRLLIRIVAQEYLHGALLVAFSVCVSR